MNPGAPERAPRADEDAPPDPLALGERVTPLKPRARVLRSLCALLGELDAAQDEWAQYEWLESFSEWLHDGGPVPPGSLPGQESLDPRSARLALLVRVLREVPAWRRAFARAVTSLIAQARGVRLFSDVGLPTEPGFVREVLERLQRGFLPRPPEPRRLAELLSILLPTVHDAAWLRDAPRDVLRDVLGLAFEDAYARRATWRAIKGSMVEATSVLAARVCALGLAPDVRDRLPEIPTGRLPFLELPRAIDALALDAVAREAGEPPPPTALAAARDAIEGCHRAVTSVLAHLERSGVSVDLVYRLEMITAQLVRLEDVLAVLVPDLSLEAEADIGHFFSTLVAAQYQHRSARSLLRQASHRLARKIIERTGHSGEHYITETRAEWLKMLGSASGGGVLTAGTAALKFLIAAGHLAPFFAGVFASINYAGSFVLMQALGFTLATKQPSMTAAALARSLELHSRRRDRGASPREIENLVDMMARITRSQFAAAVGNVVVVIPVALALDALVRLAAHRHFLDAHQGEHVVESMHLFRSATIPFAALTGVLLWLSSVAAGWLENWTVYRQLPAAIAHNRRLGRLIGRARAARLAELIAHGVCGFGGNVALGALLGMTPALGAFFGLPLDVRHVTLSTGALTFAGATLGLHAVASAAFAWAAVGVLAIGLLNFGVSFVCALAVALRARGVSRTDVVLLLRIVVARVRKRPLAFLLPLGTVSTPSLLPPPPTPSLVPRPSSFPPPAE